MKEWSRTCKTQKYFVQQNWIHQLEIKQHISTKLLNTNTGEETSERLTVIESVNIRI